jgi:Response regulator containing a CheY-like receiver domain and an HTH DNA-binding domain
MRKNSALIVDDHVLFAEVIASVLEEMKITVVGRAASADEALDLARKYRPTLVLVDLQIAGSELLGRQIGLRVLAEIPDTRVLALTDSNDSVANRELIDEGFGGLIFKEASLARFQRGIRAALDGDVLIPESLAAKKRRPTPERDEASLLASQLTLREWEVLQLLVEGLQGRAIAIRLGISSHTVRTHVQSILSKLQVHSRLEAAAFAVHHGLVEVPGRPARRRLDQATA